jgi:hypothetical protein
MRNMAIWMCFALALVFAAMANYSYFYMEREVSKETQHRGPILKWPSDLKRMYAIYADLIQSKRYPTWPLTVFRIGMFGIILCILFIIIVFR